MRAALWALGLLSCAAPDASVQSAPKSGALAQVGSRQLSPALLVALAQARPELEARELIAQWAVQARWAEAALHAQVPQHAESLALLRRLHARWRERGAQGALHDDELAQIRALAWTDYDRPPAVRAHHAVVMPARGAVPAFEQLHKVAEEVRQAVENTHDFASFAERARAVKLPLGMELRVEQLPAMTADGRGLDGSAFDARFAAAAAQLPAPWAISECVRTPFGVHVIQGAELLPAQRPSDAALRAQLHDERTFWRMRLWQEAALARARTQFSVQIADDVEAKLQRLAVRLRDEEVLR